MTERELVISKEEIHSRVGQLGKIISKDYQGKKLVIVGVLNGAFVFLADLVRSISIPHQIDFVRVASYGESDKSSGVIRVSKDVELDMTDVDVLLVEDIVDTGTTLHWLQQHFLEKQAASVRVCAFIDKHERRVKKVSVDYKGFVVDIGFLVGYGLDYAEQYRHLQEVYSLQV